MTPPPSTCIIPRGAEFSLCLLQDKTSPSAVPTRLLCFIPLVGNNVGCSQPGVSDATLRPLRSQSFSQPHFAGKKTRGQSGNTGAQGTGRLGGRKELKRDVPVCIRVALNLQRSTCLCLISAETEGMSVVGIPTLPLPPPHLLLSPLLLFLLLVLTSF